MIANIEDARKVWIDGIGESTVGAIRGESVRFITTEEAARLFSYRPETWSRWAPGIPGAFKDRLWRLPLAGCEAHIARLREPKKKAGRPWHDRTTPAHTLGGRS